MTKDVNKKPATQDTGRPSDWGSHAQTDKPWKGNPEKEQRSGQQAPDSEELDLENWQKSNTH